jgi:hypothetical protein
MDALAEDVMLQRRFTVSTKALSEYASLFTIGFARLIQKDNVEDAVSAGSGTLVTVGSVHGILTAAHVVEALPKAGQVGVILSIESPAHYQKLVVNMEHTEPPVLLKAEGFGPLGPDLAFLRVTDETRGWLKAKNSFYSLSKRQKSVLSNNEPSKSYTESITGIIHELTKEAPSERRNVRRINFHAIFCGVRLSAMRYLDTHDLLYFQLATEHEPTFKIPNSFEGASGGGIWRFYVTEKDGNPEVVERRLIGVPFHQSVTADGKREITCHGSKSIYGSMVDRVRARWPNETLPDE